MPKAAIGASKPYSEMTPIGKASYIGTFLGIIFGAIFSIWQVSALAADRIDEHIKGVVTKEAWGAVHLKVAGGFEVIQRDMRRLNALQTIQLKKMEARAIKGDIRSITKEAGGELSVEDEEDLTDLRLDRQAIIEEIGKIQEQLQQLEQIGDFST